MLKRVFFLMLAMLALMMLAGCGGDGASETTAPETTVALETAAPVASILVAELDNYVVVRPEETEDKLIDAVIGLHDAINETYGSKTQIKTDFYREGNPLYAIGEFEILVGPTNRAETAEFLSGLRADDYGYGMVGDKLVIAGHDTATTVKAIGLFRTEVLTAKAAEKAEMITAEEGRIKVGAYSIESATLNGLAIGEYTVVYDASNKQSEKAFAEYLAEEIAAVCGYVLPVVSSEQADVAEKQIRIGANTPVKAESGSYVLGIETAGHVVYAGGADATGHAAAVRALAAMLVPEGASSKIEVELGAPAPVEMNDLAMSTMSFNIYVGDNVPERRERVKKMIEAYLPDTFGVQEASDTWMLYLKRELKGYYDVVGIGRDNGTGEHSAVFYAKDKFNLIDSGTKWLSDTPDVCSKYETSSLNRIFTYAILERKSDGVRFMHVNTHFDHKSDTARQQQAGALLKFLEGYSAMPIICTGDFNTPYGGAIHKTLTAGRLGDSFDLTAGAKRSATFHNYGSSSTIIDFCFVSEDKVLTTHYAVCSEKIDGDWASDHHPVYLEYQFK